MTMATTSTTGVTAGAAVGAPGLYVVPLGSTDTLRKGLAKLQFKFTSPIMQKAAAFVFNSNTFWDRFARPAMVAALKAKGITNVRFPSGNFYANSDGVTKAAPLVIKPKGFAYYPRKGYDPATGIAYMWLVVG
ncbi:hypothetical protein E7T09_04530 [Deinococcus sp. KSM4-11]|uniref:hypothetical protein n=1 Tax=Deinococcus sp. KSM4-11 TaxID=2568654 RepID=UPI0010A3EB0D|nr:hypothetical protein [Deinococcus sp. KSM4-11]THF88477.1 hypothetical protein E7T09_04530 [Deinococcus sp. KSM4-11]